MKIKIKTIIIFLLFISISGCSYVSEKLDIATIIDKTESWLFDEEKDEQKNQQSSEENQEGNDDFASDTEEFFPDINEIPEERPTFEEIDEDFFSEETEESELSDISSSDIREKISENISVMHYTPIEIHNYIKENNLYR